MDRRSMQSSSWTSFLYNPLLAQSSSTEADRGLWVVFPEYLFHGDFYIDLCRSRELVTSLLSITMEFDLQRNWWCSEIEKSLKTWPK